VLTPAGERLLASATDVLERLQRPRTTSARWGAIARAACASPPSATPATHWLPPLLLRYRRTYPRVEVRIDVEATHRPVEMLLAGKIDVGS